MGNVSFGPEPEPQNHPTAALAAETSPTTTTTTMVGNLHSTKIKSTNLSRMSTGTSGPKLHSPRTVLFLGLKWTRVVGVVVLGSQPTSLELKETTLTSAVRASIVEMEMDLWETVRVRDPARSIIENPYPSSNNTHNRLEIISALRTNPRFNVHLRATTPNPGPLVPKNSTSFEILSQVRVCIPKLS
jgi:hypothetical protein